MNFIKQLVVKRMIRADVVHSIPGRLRLHIPFLKEIPKDVSVEKEYLQSIVQIDGIEDYEFSYITGNVMLKYDPKKVSEKIILEKIDIILRFLKANIDKIASQDMKEKDEMVKFFKKHFTIFCNNDKQ